MKDVGIPKSQWIPVSDMADVLKTRRILRQMAGRIGFKDSELSVLEIVLTELGTNLMKHTEFGGRIRIAPITKPGDIGVEICSVDEGPGIQDLDKPLAGGTSTTGSLGIGLSSVKRLMDEFQIESIPGVGTKITACKWILKDQERLMTFSVLSRPYPGEPVSGDGYFLKSFPDYELFAVMDALGHGQKAHDVMLECRTLLEANCHRSLVEIIQACHEGLRHSRGVCMALGQVDRTHLELEHVAVGNVETRIYNNATASRPYYSNGVLGVILENRLGPERYPLQPGAIVVMCTDGIRSSFDLGSALFQEPPQRISEYLFSNYLRDSDDATVLVGKVCQ